MDDVSQAEYQPNQDAGQPSGEGMGAEPKYVTEETLERMLAERDEQLKRSFQSLTDKQVSRVDKKLKQWEQRMTEEGLPVDDQLRQQARSRLALRELELMEDEPAQGVDHRIDPRIEAVRAKENELKAQYGVDLSPNDDEYYDVNFSHPNPDRYLVQYENALRAKAERLNPHAQSQPQGNPASRVPAPAGSATGSNIDNLTTELGKLQSKPNRSPAEEKRRKELEAELLKLLPRR